MGHSMRLMIVASLVCLTGMRDPFQPPADTCLTGQLPQWRYQGKVNDVGFMQDGQQRWHRVKQDQRLLTGWRVMAMDEQQLTVDVGETCDLRQWTWQREGTNKHEDKDSPAVNDPQRVAVGR
ncbi:HofP DNA utilization family protein [Enterobacter cancerogenus]|uniref:HofP DNA utilization family protein n=1 Tax=Enterobacter cancerogenus TaxID=69218 RepID=UPI003FA38086